MGYGNTAKDGTGDFWHNLCDADGKLLVVSQEWLPGSNFDDSANDSDKTYQTSGEVWILNTIWVELDTSVEAGTRQIAVEIFDEFDNFQFRLLAPVTQADDDIRYYLFGVGMPAWADWVGSQFVYPFPEVLMGDTYTLRVYDYNAVDADGDTMKVNILYRKKSV